MALRQLRYEEEERQRQRAEEIRKRRDEIADQWARNRGYDDFAEANIYGASLTDVFGEDWHRAGSMSELEAKAAGIAAAAAAPSVTEAVEKRERLAQEKARRQEILDRWARDRGHVDFDDALRNGERCCVQAIRELRDKLPNRLADAPGSLANMGEP